MKLGLCLLVAIATLGFFSFSYITQFGYGQPVDKGIIGQVLSGAGTEFYVKGVKISEESGEKLVNV